MKHIISIAQKEFKDMLRDKRTLIAMVVMPMLLFPIIITVVGSFSVKQYQKSQQQNIRVGVPESIKGHPVILNLTRDNRIKIKPQPENAHFDSLVKSGKIHVAVLLDSAQGVNDYKLTIYYNSVKNQKKNAVMEQVNIQRDSIVAGRLALLGHDKDFIKPLPHRLVDMADDKQKFGSNIGGLIPYIFILFCFLGTMYPAIDLFAGEKERGTVETLLSLPVTRIELLTGKLIVVALSGMGSALISMLGLFVGLQVADFIPEDLLSVINTILSPASVAKILLMLVPLSLFLSAGLVMLSTYARNYKEAQSMISPLTVLVIIPAVFGMMPEFELNLQNAFIPIVNISLASKAIISGNINLVHYATTVLSMVVLSGIAVWLCSKWYLKESNFIRV